MGITTKTFGTTTEGEAVQWFDCTNENGYKLGLLDFGAHLARFDAPDRDGNSKNVTLGFDAIDGYLQRHPFFGSTVGRFCNRIAKGKFVVDGVEYSLALNNGPNSLHGGDRGFDRYVWESDIVDQPTESGVIFRRRSSDGEENYPGNVDVTAKYTLNDRNEITIEFTATTDKTTPINLTNHAYWNLAGAGSGPILDHKLQVHADRFVKADENLIPTGELVPVADTPLDFNTPQTIGSRIEQIDADPVGYDHCFALRSQDGSLALAAVAQDPKSGRRMEVLTTQPGIQLYTANFLDGSSSRAGFGRYAAFCLETQHYPDSPNQPNFPCSLLKPGDTFRQTTVHRFSVE
ncbi:aldose epimerase family protein [Planctomycetota bacterium]